MSNLTFATVLKTGGEYHASHVHALYKQVQTYIPQASFVCLSDANNLDCKTIPLQHDWPGWWSKLELFKLQGPVLYTDLDTIITGNCDHWLDKIKDKKLVLLRDIYRGVTNPHAMGSGIMYWSGDMSVLYHDYIRVGCPTDIRGGDQEFLEQSLGTAEYIQDYTDDVVSYKAQIRDGDYDKIDASIIYFHGEPRPWNQSEIPFLS